MTETKKLRWLVDPKNPEHRFGIVHHCPGCRMNHIVYVAQQLGVSPHPVWTWNGEFNERITTSPSVRIQYSAKFDEEIHLPSVDRKHVMLSNSDEYDVVDVVCHYFITGGNMVFCGDSSHKFAGLTVELPNFPPGEDD